MALDLRNHGSKPACRNFVCVECNSDNGRRQTSYSYNYFAFCDIEI